MSVIPSAQLSAAKGNPSTSVLVDAAATQDELDLRQKRARRFEVEEPSSSSLSMGPIALLKNNKKKNSGKGKALPGGLDGLSIREQRAMSGPPDPVFNPVGSLQNKAKISKYSSIHITQDVIEWDEQTIVGTSRQLEKPYLRLTSAPDSREVRPLPILRQTLEHLKRKWRTEGNYAWVCDQFKSLRQDLTASLRYANKFPGC